MEAGGRGRDDGVTAPGSAAPGRAGRVLRAVVSSAVLALPVAALALAVRAPASALHALDVRAVTAATEVTRAVPALHTALLVWQEVTRPGWLALGVAGVCVWVARRRSLPARARWGVVTVLAAWAASGLLKLTVQRQRPVLDEPLAHAGGLSFPSGHATGAAAAGAVLVTVVWPLLGRRGRVLLPAAAVVVAGLTAADRVLLGVHHPSDVVAGLVLGAAVTAGSWIGWTRGGPVGDEAGARRGAPAGTTAADVPRPRTS